MAKKEAEQALLEEIAASDDPINATLYEQYSRNLRKAVDGVFAEDNSGGLSDRLRANVSRFAAYKAYHATGEIRKEIGKNGNIDAGRKELHAFNRYQAAEYNTTVSRCRTAKQFQEFSQPDNVRLFPNIKWLPSRSATPREQHILFYNRVWAKNDSFWNTNQPGNLWNCKCDWEETDEPVTDGNPTTPIRHDGLEKNPAITGEVFTDEASYIKNAIEDTEFSCRDANLKLTAKLGKQIAKERSVTKEIDGNVYEFSFKDFVYRHDGKKDKAQICRHFAGSMFGNENYWLKNEILLSPQRYLDNAVLIVRADVDTHNTGAATIALKEATDQFFYFETKLANGEKVILHVGRYRAVQKLYLYAASKELPEYVENPQ